MEMNPDDGPCMCHSTKIYQVIYCEKNKNIQVALEHQLESLGATIKLDDIEKLWLVKSKLTAEEFYSKLIKENQELNNQKILVFEINTNKKSCWGRFKTSLWEWLGNRKI